MKGDAEVRRGRDGGLVRRMTKPDMRVGAPCGACNNGWMSDLETNFQRVGGGRLLAGDAPVSLGVDEIRVVARWLVKTTLMLHAAVAHETGQVDVPRAHYEAIKAVTAVEGTNVFIAGVDAAGRDICYFRPIQLDRQGEPLAYVMSMSIGYLLGVVAAPIPARATWVTSVPPSFANHVDRIWPIPDSRINWPRTRDLTVDAFDEAWQGVTWRVTPVVVGAP